MKDFFTQKPTIIIGRILLILLIIAIPTAYSEYRYRIIGQEFIKTNQELVRINQELATNTEGLQKRISDLEGELTNTKKEALTRTDTLAEQLQVQQSASQTLQDQLGKIDTTVGTLDKLSKTDPELLQKYSKVYFLNENYVPLSLTEIDPKYINEKDKEIEVISNVYPYLQKLLDASILDKVSLQILSGFRSFGTQAVLKSTYRFVYGAGTANQFSAEQGYSEHQLGTTVDFTTPTIGSILAGFDKTPEYAWLLNNAYKYGFVISYPKDNTYYTFEPWHWRFVGVALAIKLHTDNKYFYDMDQREIDTYLANIFD